METKKTKRRKKNIARRIVLIIFGIIFGVNIYLGNATGIVGNKLPMPFGYGLANVLSGSMEPTFSKGALLVVKEETQPEKGQIVVYQSGNELIVHRIINIDKNTITTKGDANNIADEPFDQTQIKGVVVTWIPYLGSIASMLKTPIGMILVLVAAFLLIESSFRKQREADDDEIEAIKEEIRRLKEETKKE